MRIRKRKRLSQRMLACERVLIADPEQMRGKWISNGDYKTVYLEIGCGKGLFTNTLADENPDVLIVAAEKVSEALIIAMERACLREWDNIRFLNMDARLICDVFAPGELSRLYLNFSDPWPKNRNADRRLTSPEFLELYRCLLPDKGEIHLKTDNLPFFRYSLLQMSKAGYELFNISNDLHENGISGILTDYELKFIGQGKKINSCIARKVV